MSLVDRVRGRYGAVAIVALLGLGPYVVLSTALFASRQVMAADLHAGTVALQLTQGLGNAAYAVGAVGAAQLAQKLGQRRLYLAYQTLFVTGSLVAAAAGSSVVLGVGRALQGLGAGAMLISALPPLVTRFGVRRLPLTVVVVNIGLFGGATLGPAVGGAVAAAGSWRGLLVAAAVVGAAGLALAAVAYPPLEANDPEMPVDTPALLLAAACTVPLFVGTSLLQGASLTSPQVVVPILVGVLTLPALVVAEVRRPDPLVPVRVLSTQLPVTGTTVALVGGAVFVTVVELVQTSLTQVGDQAPDTAGWLFWPMPVGLAVAAVAFGALFRTRYVPLLADLGLAVLVAAALLPALRPPSESPEVVPYAAALLGFGAGATVSPGLFMCGLGMPSRRLGRAFALVQLLRSVTTFAVGPVVLHLALQAASPTRGITGGLVATAALAAAGLVAALLVPALSGARLRAPDLESWLDGGQALPSPATATHVRPGPPDAEAEPLVPRGRREPTPHEQHAERWTRR